MPGWSTWNGKSGASMRGTWAESADPRPTPFAVMRALRQNSRMTRPAPDLTRPDPAEKLIVYEQPLIERMRTFLRLEFLFQQAHEHAGAPTAWGTRAAVASLLEVVAILARGDVRSDVLKELERHSGLLGQFESVRGVDDSRLSQLLDRIVKLRTQLNSAGQLHRLNDNEFLSAIKHRSIHDLDPSGQGNHRRTPVPVPGYLRHR